MKPNKKPEWTFTNPEDRTVQPEKPVCTTCGDSGKGYISYNFTTEIATEIPCPDCQKQKDGYCPECTFWKTCGNGYKSESGSCDDWTKTKKQEEVMFCPDCQKWTDKEYCPICGQVELKPDYTEVTKKGDLESRITELEQQRDEAVKLLRDYPVRKSPIATYLWIINKINFLAQLTADNRQEGE